MNTKIYGTIGPACCQTEMLVRLFEKGMTGVRINLSHTNLSDAAEWMDHIQAAYKLVMQRRQTAGTYPCQPEILMDLRGPELRIGKLLSDRVLEEGERISLIPDGRNDLFDPTEIPVPKLLFPHIQAGQEILLDDGKILLEVEGNFAIQGAAKERDDTLDEQCNYGLECRVLRGGVLKSSKSIKLQNVVIHPPTLTESDILNIKAAKSYGITGVMLPFVRGKEDLLNLKQALDAAGAMDIRIFAKIENEEGIKKLQELLPHCDEIVIARGDLGNAMPLWELPVAQAKIALKCREKQKPFMVVTQMLASMEKAAVPTRAEVSDIFRAVNEGAASVMLTGETAAGKYPVEAMEYLVNTIREAEHYIQ